MLLTTAYVSYFGLRITAGEVDFDHSRPSLLELHFLMSEAAENGQRKQLTLILEGSS